MLAEEYHSPSGRTASGGGTSSPSARLNRPPGSAQTHVAADCKRIMADAKRWCELCHPPRGRASRTPPSAGYARAKEEERSGAERFRNQGVYPSQGPGVSPCDLMWFSAAGRGSVMVFSAGVPGL